jgi:hypothetical protein
MAKDSSDMQLARARRQARRMRIVNVPMRVVLGLPFPTPLGGQLMLVFFRGRKTGKAYRQPVSYVRDAETLLTPGGGNWKLNLSEGEPVRLRLRGHDVQARPEFVRDPGEVKQLLQKMMDGNPRLASFVPFIDSDKRIDEARMAAALQHGFCIVRWHLPRRRSSLATPRRVRSGP